MIHEFEKLFPLNLYHSYVIEGEPENTGVLLLEFLKTRGLSEDKNPDLLFQNYESFTIENSSEIKDWHSRSGIGDQRKICILATRFINREAEQTLLKIIEEPKEDTHFFIIIPDSSVLAGTIISRVHVVKTKQPLDADFKKFVQSFILMLPKDRVDKIAVVVKENKNEENSGQLRSYATQFVNELEDIYYKKFIKDKNDKQVIYILEELQKSRNYLSTPGASVKMILEHLALVI
jgi:DNA polymerase III delta prime subunit